MRYVLIIQMKNKELHTNTFFNEHEAISKAVNYWYCLKEEEKAIIKNYYILKFKSYEENPFEQGEIIWTIWRDEV